MGGGDEHRHPDGGRGPARGGAAVRDGARGGRAGGGGSVRLAGREDRALNDVGRLSMTNTL